MSHRPSAMLLIGSFAAVPVFAGVNAALLFEKSSTGYVTRSGKFAVSFDRSGAKLRISGSDSMAVTMRLAGRSRMVDPQGTEPSPAKLNYLVGQERDWRTGVTAYQKVVYAGVYRGVDLVFYNRGKLLEYDFVVAPGSDPSAIQVRWSGARNVNLNDHGDLIISAGAGQVQWDAPFIYQRVNGERKQIEGGFKLFPGGRVGFRIGHYDPRLEVVIDPTVAYATYLGASLAEFSRGAAVDASGNLYVAGFTDSDNLLVTKTAYQSGYGGNTSNINSGDGFIAKYSPTGALIFLTYLGGHKDDAALALTLDATGNIYITGYTNSTDFPITSGAFQKTFAGYSGTGAIVLGDAFVTKMSSDGTALIYSTYLGGSQDDAGLAIAVDKSGNAYVTGCTLSTNFPVTSSAYQARLAGFGGQEFFPRLGVSAIVSGDAFVAKLNPLGSALVYSTYLGGNQDDLATTIAIDNAGDAYVGGFTLSGNFPTTSGAPQTRFSGSDIQNFFFTLGDGFLAKLDPTGSKLLYSTYIGGQGDDWVTAVAVDSAGNLYATGSTSSFNFPVTKGSFQSQFRGPLGTLPILVEQIIGDAFLLKLNPAGTALLFSTYLGGSGDDCGMAIAFDNSGNIIVAGNSNSKDFPVTPDAVQKTLAGPGYLQNRNSAGDGFIAQFTPSGAQLYGTFLGGTRDDGILSVAVSASGTVYVSGFTLSQDFPVLNAAQKKNGATYVTAMDGFVASISGFGGGSGGNGPVINAVLNSTGETAVIAQNTWIEVHGQNLAPDKREWQGSDFVNGQLPTQLDGVSVKVNGKPAFIYYISDVQVNALTPIDSTTGQVFVQLTNGSNTSGNVAVPMQSYAPGFFQFDGIHVAAVHPTGSAPYVGPTSLGSLFAPAKPGETIELYANGFGQTSPPVINGSEGQSGSLTVTPVIKIGGFIAPISFSGVVAPGEYLFNVMIPTNLADGDATVAATFNGLSTQPGAMITIHH